MTALIEVIALVGSLAGFWLVSEILINKYWEEDGDEYKIPPRCAVCWSITLTAIITGFVLNLIPASVTLVLFSMMAWEYARRFKEKLIKAENSNSVVRRQVDDYLSVREASEILAAKGQPTSEIKASLEKLGKQLQELSQQKSSSKKAYYLFIPLLAAAVFGTILIITGW